MVNIDRILAELREEHTLIQEAITRLERLSATRRMSTPRLTSAPTSSKQEIRARAAGMGDSEGN
jgi:hypothetical protein